MCVSQLADWMEELEDVSPGAKAAQSAFKFDSKNAERIGNALGWDSLEKRGKWNQQNPEEGLAHAGIATVIGAMLAGSGGGAVGLMGGGAGGGMTAGGSAGIGAGLSSSGVSGSLGTMAGLGGAGASAAELAAAYGTMPQSGGIFGVSGASMPSAGVIAPGMEGAATLDSLLINNGMSSMAGGYGTQALGGLMGGSGMSGAGRSLMAQQGMGLMSPQQSPQGPAPRTQARPPPPQITLRDDPMGLAGMNLTEEQRAMLLEKLRAQGYPV